MKESSFIRTPEEVLNQPNILMRCTLFTIQKVGVMLVLEHNNISGIIPVDWWFLVLN
jgi:hypothetical protein